MPTATTEPPISAPELDWTVEDGAFADAVADEAEVCRRRALMGLA